MTSIDAVVIGCSAGGLQALKQILPTLCPTRAVPVLVACHTASDDLRGLCDLLSAVSAWPVREAREREIAAPGVIQMAPSGYHLLVERSGELSLSIDPRVSFARPSIDVLFESAAIAYGAHLAGIVMTGANHDGAQGLARVRHGGGIGVIQDPDEAEVDVMPRAALAQAGADHVLPLVRIGPFVSRLIDQRSEP